MSYPTEQQYAHVSSTKTNTGKNVEDGLQRLVIFGKCTNLWQMNSLTSIMHAIFQSYLQGWDQMNTC